MAATAVQDGFCLCAPALAAKQFLSLLHLASPLRVVMVIQASVRDIALWLS